MPENKPRRLNEIVPFFAPEGANDRRWFLVEHQLIQARTSAHAVVVVLEKIVAQPENMREGMIAEDCLRIMKGMYLDIQEHYATFLSYLSDTDVPERISRKEL